MQDLRLKPELNTPIIWIVFPIGVGILLLPIDGNDRAVSVLGGFIALLLAVAAQFVPIELAMNIGSISLKINSTFIVLGRTLLLRPEEGPLLVLIYGAVACGF